MPRLPLPFPRLALLGATVLAFAAVVAANIQETRPLSNLLELSIPEIDEALQTCPFVRDLNAQRIAALPETSSLMKRIFAVLFPAGPAINSLLATAYISGPPSPLLPSCLQLPEF